MTPIVKSLKGFLSSGNFEVGYGAIHVFITRNVKDYKLSQFPVLTPDNFLR